MPVAEKHRPQPQPHAFHVMLKPRGPICNLDCQYCYYLSKAELYPGSRFRMSPALLEAYISQYIASQRGPEVVFGWQGGEPTLMGLPFFRKAIELQQKCARPGQRITNAFQTNGIRIDDEWCRFFKQNNFLVGLSLDGPRGVHDAYRIDRAGRPTFDAVIAALKLLQKHRVEYNILATVHAASAAQPLAVYQFLRDEAGGRFLQFIPIVARDGQASSGTAAFSITPRAYGDFLISIFDEWVQRDVGTVFVQMFDAALAAWCGLPPGLCVFQETCGDGLALEHNGDLYACDHFVDPDHLLGNIMDRPLLELAASDLQRRFGQDKKAALPGQCRACEVRFVCNGGCPKDRISTTTDREPDLNYLCEGYFAFFKHIHEAMLFMANELRNHRSPANVMKWMKR
jgi:uncharacterized protein